MIKLRIGLVTSMALWLVVITGCQAVEDDQSSQKTDQEISMPMTADRIGELILNVDPDAILKDETWFLQAGDREILVIFDSRADRMRIMIPILDVADLKDGQAERMLQANFDSALDARYAIARETVWSTFIHPLSPLSSNEFLFGLWQTINAAETFGSSYSSGVFTFGGGDTADEARKKLLERLQQPREST